MSAALALKFQGTEGPWTMVEDGFGGEWQIRGKEDGEYIDGRAVDRTPVVVDYIGNKADARLITAAPELLEALIDASCLINAMWEGSAVPATKPTLELVNTINAAIAKALKP